ncbi:MAG TPA: MBL fold metallo-hydrolase [Micromonosporaceae bacterium]|nr:MBL fold metallo-hydrolase [Micromonosporaceae bacterium]
MIDFTAATPIEGSLDVAWIHGAPKGQPNTDPPIQVHAYDEHTYILRQSKATSFEAPFLYLFFGNDRALLLDTGATKDPTLFPLRDTVDSIVREWTDRHPHDSYHLVVAHTHGHGDHVAGDAQFTDRANTTVVPADVASSTEFFGFTSWPAEIVSLDLGGRVLEVTGIPGHDERSIAVYDPWTGFLVTGDSVYPGRLYVRDMPAYVDSMQRLVALAANRQVTHVMGCHIEMTRTARHDYHTGCRYQPHEPPLQMTVGQLAAVRDAAAARAGRRGVHVSDDFVLFNGMDQRQVPIYLGYWLWTRVRNRIARV